MLRNLHAPALLDMVDRNRAQRAYDYQQFLKRKRDAILALKALEAEQREVARRAVQEQAIGE